MVAVTRARSREQAPPVLQVLPMSRQAAHTAQTEEGVRRGDKRHSLLCAHSGAAVLDVLHHRPARASSQRGD